MRTIKKGYCPNTIEINGSTLKMYAAASASTKPVKTVAAELEAQGLTVCILECMNPKLKGKNDLHGQPYKPSTFIFADLHTEEQIKAWRDKVEFWKTLFKPRPKQYLRNVMRLNKAGKLQHFKGPGESLAQNQAIKELLN